MFNLKKEKKVKQEEAKMLAEKQVKKSPKTATKLFLIYFSIFAVFMGFYFSFNSTYVVSSVTGTSMQPTINDGVNDQITKEDYVYINTKTEIQRNDIIVIDLNPNTQNDFIIKRAIALGGDKITIRVGADGFYHTYVIPQGTQNMIQLEEEYVKNFYEWTNGKHGVKENVNGIEYEKIFYDNFLINPSSIEEVGGVLFYEIPENQVFYMGDNRGASSDAREKGTCSIDQVVGVAEIIVDRGCVKDGGQFFRRIGSIFMHYWEKIEIFFDRSADFS